MSQQQYYLDLVDQVIEQGPFSDDWASLGAYCIPKWYENAKFGIFIHWGVYSVPAFGSEWYPRNMYCKGSVEYEHHKKTYGDHKNFGYHDFVPKFQAEQFDPKAWVELFEKAGAKYVMPVAEHHDGFQMYDSDLSEWCASKMGPKRDLIGDLKQEIEAKNLIFCASNHRAENYWFFNGAQHFDSGLNHEGLIEPYGYRDVAVVEGEPTHDVHSAGASKEHLDNWLARCCEFVEQYRPRVMWFDWWIQNHSFKPYLKKFAAYYYNRAKEWGIEVAINYKFEAYGYGTAVFDVERGQLSAIRPRFWQTDTAVAKNSWGYTENNDFKDPADLVCDLIDIVSKNGAMLLNIGPRADGTITKEDEDILLAIGNWLSINGESIYNTTYWKYFGEGPTKIKEGAFTDTDRAPFTSKDIRYTYCAPTIYANVLSFPKDGKVCMEKLGYNENNAAVQSVELLGYPHSVTFTQTKDCLQLSVSEPIATDYPVCFKITID